MATTDRWTLRQGSTVLASIEVTAHDQPWHRGRLLPCDGFTSVAALFERELKLLEADDDWSGWEAAYEEIYTLGVQLHLPDGSAVGDFLLHTDGTEVWFRWSDQPFAR